MKPSLWICLFLSGVLLAACTRQNSPLVIAASAASAPESCAAAPEEALTVLTQWDAASGYYYLARQNGGDFVLHFVDYATLEDSAVCSAGCDHTGEGCTARLAWDGCDIRVYAARDRLFVVYGGEAKEQAGTARVISCERDGSHRQELARFGASEAFASMPAADGQNLYIILADYSSAGGPVEKIVTIDLASGATSADEAVQRAELRIVGAWGRELILQSGLGRNYYAAYNVDTKELRDLASTDSTAVVFEGSLCFLDEATGAIRTVSVEDGSVTELATDLTEQASPQWAMLAGVTEQGYVVQASGEDVYHNWLIDFGGRAVRQELQAESTEERDHMRMLEIFARQGEDYLVSPSRSFHTVLTPGPNGVTYGEDVVDYAFALISAKDFWSGTPNYRAVTRVG